MFVPEDYLEDATSSEGGGLSSYGYIMVHPYNITTGRFPYVLFINHLCQDDLRDLQNNLPPRSGGSSPCWLSVNLVNLGSSLDSWATGSDVSFYLIIWSLMSKFTKTVTK